MALQTLKSRFNTHLCTCSACAECHVWQKGMKIGGRFSRMISVIIPTYNEAGDLTATLDSVARSKTIPEVIVVDAGSSDGTGDLARRRASCVLVSPRRQRACQMNLGARHAHGRALLFLHADTRLPTSALDRIESALLNDRVVGGGFARRYDSNSWFLRTTCLLAGLRTRMIGWFLGDQAIFVRRETFEKLEGFRDLELFEDLDFSMRMRQTGRVVTLPPPVISSSRRFIYRGPVLTTLLDAWLTCRYLTGTDPIVLAGVRCASVPHKPRVGTGPGARQGTLNS
jgi:rSAM/selenodomain-associated transferase 2